MFSGDFGHRAGACAAIESRPAAACFMQVVQIVGLLRFMSGIATALRVDNNSLEKIGQNRANGTVGNVVADTGLHGDRNQL